jgi:predicted  nucleic acid-binding Zn-ribbon protein
MAKQQFDPNDAKQLALEIEKIYKRMGQSSPFSRTEDDLETLKAGLEDARDILLDWQDGIGDIERGFRAILNEVNTSGKSFTIVKRSLTSITSISAQLRDQQLGINQLSSKQLINLKNKLDSEATSLKNNLAALQTAKKELEDKYEAYFKSIFEEMKSKANDGKREWTTTSLTHKMASDVAEYLKLCELKISVYNPDSRNDDDK